jgi:hypothetical protein
MNRNRSQHDTGTMQLLGMVAGLMVAPVATPALIWATIAANLPLTPVIMQLFALAVFSNWLSRKAIRNYKSIEGTSDDLTLSNTWSSEPPNG